MRKARARAWSALGTRYCPDWHWLGPGNTNVRAVGGYWVGTRYSPSRYPPSHTTPGTTPPLHHRRHTSDTRVLTSRTCTLRPTKEILGVNNAQCLGTDQYPRAGHCPSLLVGPCSRAPGAYSEYISVISQLYLSFMVFLRYGYP